MNTLTRRRATSPWSDIVDWFETWPAVTDWRLDAAHALRIEDRTEPDRYVLRVELPGIDPEKDVTVSVTDGVLSIAAERQEAVTDSGRSEFRYGTFERRVALPPRAKEDALTARYADGILEITVPLAEDVAQPRVVPVSRTATD